MSSLTALPAVSSHLTATAAAAAATAPTFSNILASFSSNKHMVGSAWIISSTILTTYSTTKFLKYRDPTPSSTPLSNPVKNAAKRIESPIPRAFRPVNMPRLSRASLLTLYRFSGSLFLGLVVHPQIWKIVPRILKTLQSAQLFLLPALFLFIANYSNSIALDRIGISLTYTSKCGIPLITVLLTLLLDGVDAMPSLPTILSLVPIAAGIGAASWNSPTFEKWGFAAAMLSTTSQAALNVGSKRVMKRTGIAGPEAQRAMVTVALAIALVVTSATSIVDFIRSTNEGEAVPGGDVSQGEPLPLPPGSEHPPLWLTVLAVIGYHAEYVLSFIFVSLVEPITYGTCDAIRRLLIIIAGRQMFGGDRFSKLNLGGIGFALLGALSYSITSARGK